MTDTPSQSSGTRLLRVGDLAKVTGKTVRAIRLYEELGLLRPASRTSGGFRLYEPAAVERVRWIGLFHGMGLSLQEMRELVHAWWGAGLGPEAMDRLRSLFKSKLEETREAVRRSQQLERELSEGLAYLEACRACAAPSPTAEGCVVCQQDHGMERAPALVAGLKSASPGRGTRRGPVIVGVGEIE